MNLQKRIAALLVLFSFAFFINSCKYYHRNKAHADVPLSSIREGESLAAVYCQSCHLLPDPSLANARSWEKGILPNMGPRLGIFSYKRQRYSSSINDPDIGKSFYPSAPLLKPEQWGDLMNYYIATSPDTLPQQQRTATIQTGLPLFKAQSPPIQHGNPTTCFIRVDTSNGSHSLLLCDVQKKDFVRLNDRLLPVDSVIAAGPVVDIQFQPSGMLACDIGRINPNTGKFGKAQHIDLTKDGKMKMDSLPLLDSLARPVQVTAVDLNQDGLTDFLVCEFGNLTGAL